VLFLTCEHLLPAALLLRVLRVLCGFHSGFHLDFYSVNAEIIAVSSEMLTPFRMDTNSLYLSDPGLD
jgi:hypothetical protein